MSAQATVAPISAGLRIAFNTQGVGFQPGQATRGFHGACAGRCSTGDQRRGERSVHVDVRYVTPNVEANLRAAA